MRKSAKAVSSRAYGQNESEYWQALTRFAVQSPRRRSLAVLDGEAIVLRPPMTLPDFEALRSRQGQAEAILVAYDIMEVEGQDVRPEPLEERRKRWRSCYLVATRRCVRGSSSVRRSPATGPPSFVMPVGWTLKGDALRDDALKAHWQASRRLR